jgi:hypothetical protein
MLVDELFPTRFAISLGEESGIVEKQKRGYDVERYHESNSRMQEFQQMAISCSYEDARLAFHGFRITEKQEVALKTIYNSTRPWALGNASSVLLGKLNSIGTSGRDAKEIVIALTECLAPKSVSKTTGSSTGRFIVNLTQVKSEA